MQIHDRLRLNPSTLVLARGEIASLRLRSKACRVSCVAGRLWVTMSKEHEEMTVTGRGTVAIETLRTGTLRIQIGTTAYDGERTRAPFGRLPTGLLTQ